MKNIINTPHRLFSITVMLIGLGIIVLAFINSPVQIKVALGLIGLGFMLLGTAQIKRSQDEAKLDRIMAKLEEIEQELKKEKPQEKGGTVIADIISSGLKYYTDRMTDKEKE